MDAIRRALGWARARWACSRAVAQESRTLFPIQNDREERYARLRGWLPSDA